MNPGGSVFEEFSWQFNMMIQNKGQGVLYYYAPICVKALPGSVPSCKDLPFCLWGRKRGNCVVRITLVKGMTQLFTENLVEVSSPPCDAISSGSCKLRITILWDGQWLACWVGCQGSQKWVKRVVLMFPWWRSWQMEWIQLNEQQSPRVTVLFHGLLCESHCWVGMVLRMAALTLALLTS